MICLTSNKGHSSVESWRKMPSNNPLIHNFLFEEGFPERRRQILHAVGSFIHAIGRFDLFSSPSFSVCTTIRHSAQSYENMDAKHRRRTSPKRPVVCKCDVMLIGHRWIIATNEKQRFSKQHRTRCFFKPIKSRLAYRALTKFGLITQHWRGVQLSYHGNLRIILKSHIYKTSKVEEEQKKISGPSCSKRRQLNELVKGHFVNYFSGFNIQYSDIFGWKNVSSFCTAKATHIFSAKNFSIFAYHSIKILTNR